MADDPPSGSRLRVSVVDAEGRPLPARRLASWLASIAPRRARGAVTIAVVSDSHVRRLNRKYRGIDRPTDVLSFPASPQPPLSVPNSRGTVSNSRKSVEQPFRAATGRDATGRAARAWAADRRAEALPHVRPGHLGDIVIARGVAHRQARRARHSAAMEWRILALHGLLHLLGYDHEHDDGRMERVERRLRRKGGLPPALIERSVPA